MVETQTQESEMKKYNIVRDFLEMKKGMVFDGIKARNAMKDEWGIDIDWHIFTEVMDEMTRFGGAIVVEVKNGRTTFMIN